MKIIAHDCSCSACGPASESVCGHLGRSGFWCVYCGAPVVRRSGWRSVVAASAGLWWDGLWLELWLGRLSRYAMVRWWAARRA